MLLALAGPVGVCLWNTSWGLRAFLNTAPRSDHYTHLLNYSAWWGLADRTLPLNVPIDLHSTASWLFCCSCAVTFPLASIMSVLMMSRVNRVISHAKAAMSTRTIQLQRQLNRAMIAQVG